MHFTYTDKDILDGRFEFRQSGTFRVLSPFATLKIAIACIVELMFALYSLNVLLNGGAISDNTSIIIIKIALAVILPILPIWYILIVAGGEQQYSYYADERLMRIANKRHTYIFRYSDIENVTYKPMTLFRKQKGYTVTVTTKIPRCSSVISCRHAQNFSQYSPHRSIFFNIRR